MERPYKQVDVFTSVPYRGNALAVVLDGAGLSEADMLRFANWTNLAETTFILPPTQAGADYRVRIFTTTTELPFAGHPTLGTAHAWLEAGGRSSRPGVVVQECAAGPAGLVPESYTVRQGTRLGRAGHVQVFTDDGGVWIAGQAVTCIDGTMRTR